VVAFREGADDLGRDGIAGPQTLAALETASRPILSNAAIDMLRASGLAEVGTRVVVY